MPFKVLRGFCLDGGKDVFPGDVVDIPQSQRHMIPAWRTQGKIGEEIAGKPQMMHKGRGKYDVLNAEGGVVAAGVSKTAAEKELAWLLKDEESDGD